MNAALRSTRSGAKAFKATPKPVTRTSRLVVLAKKDEISDSYAKALVEVAAEKGKLDGVRADMDTIAALMSGDSQLRSIMVNPTVAASSKTAVLEKLAQEAGFQSYTTNFMKVLVDKDRVSQIDQILESFEEQYCTMTQTQVALVRSAVKLEQEQQFAIAKKLQELTGSKNIKLKPVLDASLIGGFVVEFGSTQIDMSIRGQIEKYGEQLQKSVANTFA